MLKSDESEGLTGVDKYREGHPKAERCSLLPPSGQMAEELVLKGVIPRSKFPVMLPLTSRSGTWKMFQQGGTTG